MTKTKTWAKAKPKGHPPTDEQRAILEAIAELNPGEALMVEAGAGTGKTTTLRMMVDVLPGNGQYTAFNTSLVAESKDKFAGTRCACNTTHSLAFRAEGKRFSHRLGGSRVKAEQIAKMLGVEELNVPFGDDGQKRLAPGWLASQVMGAIRRFCQSADQEITTGHFRYVDGIDPPTADGVRTYSNNERVREHLLPYAKQAWKDICDEDGQLPFSHDHYVKIWQLNRPIISADYVLLDEAQDTAPVMLSILEQQKATKILVGDSAQQIYEWRGAVNALAAFPGAPRRFLSQSFRFGEAIADVANRVLETLEEPTQLRLRGLSSIDSQVVAKGETSPDAPAPEFDAILCRTNAMAVSRLLAAIADGKRPFLVGGGSDVIAFVEAAQHLQEGRSTSHPDLACFGSWTEVQEYSKQDEGEDLRLLVKLIDSFGTGKILGALRAMPAEKDADIVISTAHKSKGREWNRVNLAADFPTKSKCSDSDRKLLYVAVTRAKHLLDVSECPFFTGEDALDISHAIAGQQRQPQSILPAAPATQPAPEQYTWARARNGSGWLVRGAVGHEGETVEVVRKDGSTSKKKLIESTWDNGTVALYQV